MKKFAPPYTAKKSLSSKLAWMNNSRTRLEFKGCCLKQDDKTTFTPNNIVNLFIVYELNRWSKDSNAEFTLKDCLFGNVKITKNVNPDKYSYSGYGMGFDSRSFFQFQMPLFLELNMTSSVHVDNKNKNVLMLGKGLRQGLGNTTLTAEAEYSINFSRSQGKFC